jgi:hypothetical protein
VVWSRTIAKDQRSNKLTLNRDTAPANQGDLRRGLVDVVAAEGNAAAMIADRCFFISLLCFLEGGLSSPPIIRGLENPRPNGRNELRPYKLDAECRRAKLF